jgi:hypothetical protein
MAARTSLKEKMPQNESSGRNERPTPVNLLFAICDLVHEVQQVECSREATSWHMQLWEMHL